MRYPLGMKLYTRTGDDGTTGLFGGQRVEKDDPRVDAYGTVDELNATVGLAAAACAAANHETSHATSELNRRYDELLVEIQSRLFDIGADLATPPGSEHADKVARFDGAHAAAIEAWIDEIDAGNAPMTHFVLPGGTDLAARLHLARAVCRRAERLVVTLSRSTDVTGSIIIYLNRLSDLLFAMARRANVDAGVPDVPWIGGDRQ